MGNSLHEQLLKAGLVNEKQVKQAQKQKRKKTNQQRKSKAGQDDQTRREARQSQLQSAERDRALNRQRQARLQKRQRDAQIRQLIESNRLTTDDAEVGYSFVHDNKVARIYVNEGQRKQLGQGGVAIVTLDRRYVLVPAAVADKIRQSDASRVIFCNDKLEDEAIDEEYADYKIPDDLIW